MWYIHPPRGDRGGAQDGGNERGVQDERNREYARGGRNEGGVNGEPNSMMT